MAKPEAPRFSIRRFLVTTVVVTVVWMLLVMVTEHQNLASVGGFVGDLGHTASFDFKSLFYDPPLAAGDIKRARAVFENDIRSHLTDPTTYGDIAAACMKHNRLDLAREYLERSLLPCKDLPRNQRADLYASLSSLELQLDKTKPQQSAILYAQRAADLEPDSPGYLNAYGYLLANNDQLLDEALLRTGQALQLMKKQPDTPENRFVAAEVEDSYGWALYKLGRYDAAATALNQAISDVPDKEITGSPVLNPTLTVLYYHLGATYHKSGQLDAARGALQTALRFDAANKEARAELDDLKKDPPSIAKEKQTARMPDSLPSSSAKASRPSGSTKELKPAGARSNAPGAQAPGATISPLPANPAPAAKSVAQPLIPARRTSSAGEPGNSQR